MGKFLPSIMHLANRLTKKLSNMFHLAKTTRGKLYFELKQEEVGAERDMEQFRKERSSGEHEVTKLNKEMAEIIIKHNIKVNWNLPCLHFRNLKYLSPDAAQVLAGYNWKFSIPWIVVQENWKALGELLKHEADTDFTEVGELTPEMVSAFKDVQRHISLYNVKNLGVEAAKALVPMENIIFISVDTWPSDEVMNILKKRPSMVIVAMKK